MVEPVLFEGKLSPTKFHAEKLITKNDLKVGHLIAPEFGQGAEFQSMAYFSQDIEKEQPITPHISSAKTDLSKSQQQSQVQGVSIINMSG